MSKLLKALDHFIRSELNDLKTECDAHSYLVSNILNKSNIRHTRLAGYVIEVDTGNIVMPHAWNVLGDKNSSVIIDFKLSYWLENTCDEDSGVPDGVFCTYEYENYIYVTKQEIESTYNEDVINAITNTEGGFDRIVLPCHLSTELKLELNL